MPKEFYTEKDIEDMFKRGVQSLEVSDNVVLTGLAYEKAQKLGMNTCLRKTGQPSGGTRPPLCCPGFPGAARAPGSNGTDGRRQSRRPWRVCLRSLQTRE